MNKNLLFWNKVSRFVYSMALLAGGVLTVIGLADFPWPKPIPWNDKSTFIQFFGFLLFAAIAISLLALKLKGQIYVSAVVLAVIFVISSGAVGPLLVVIIFTFASSLLGRWLLEKLGAGLDSWITFFLFGAGIYGTAVGLLAHFPVIYAGTLGSMVALPLVLDHRRLMQWIQEFGTMILKPHSRSRKNGLLDLAISVLALMLIIVALMPEVGPDALVTHLFIPAHLLHRHQWGFDASKYVWAVAPMLGDWIFSVSYVLGSETAARLTNIGFIFTLSWIVRDLVRWAGGSEASVRWAVLIFLSSPLTFTEGSSLFVESVWASFLLAGVLAILKACTADKMSSQKLTAEGALLGFALATKAVTFTYLSVLLLPIIWNLRTWVKTGITKALLPGIGLFLFIGGIPYITAWQLTGNPVFPFFNQIFHSPLFPNTNFEDLRWGKDLTWDFIYRLTFQTGKYMEATPGAAGFQWLLLFIPSLALLLLNTHKRGLGLVAIALVSIILCFHSTAYLRYIFPAYIVLIAAIGVSISLVQNMVWMQVRATYIIAIITVFLNLLFYSAGPFVYRDFPIFSVFSESQKDAYLSRRLPIRSAVKLVNAINLQRTPVAVFGYPQVAGLNSNALLASWFNPSFQSNYSKIKTTQDAIDLLIYNQVDFIISDTSSNDDKVQYALIAQVATEISRIGSISVLKFNDNLRFNKELLRNPEFLSLNGWSLSGDAKFDATTGTVKVSVSSPVTQTVAVIAGQKYKNSVVARCLSALSQGRIQVNWHDARGEFLGTNIELFECKPDWREFSMNLVAPEKAVTAVVYTTSHSENILEFNSVSFKH